MVFLGWGSQYPSPSPFFGVLVIVDPFWKIPFWVFVPTFQPPNSSWLTPVPTRETTNKDIRSCLWPYPIHFFGKDGITTLPFNTVYRLKVLFLSLRPFFRGTTSCTIFPRDSKPSFESPSPGRDEVRHICRERERNRRREGKRNPSVNSVRGTWDHCRMWEVDRPVGTCVTSWGDTEFKKTFYLVRLERNFLTPLVYLCIYTL